MIMVPEMAKGTLQLLLRLKTLRWKIVLNYLGGLNLITVSLKVQEKVRKVGRSDVT